MTVSPICQVSDSGGPYNPTGGGINVNPGDTVAIQLVTPGPVSQWFLQVYGTDELTPPSSITLMGVDPVTNQVSTPATTVTFAYPVTMGSAVVLLSTVTGSGGPLSTTFEVFTLTHLGKRVGATGETREGNSTFGWAATVNPAIRSLGFSFENNGSPVSAYPYAFANFIGVGVSVSDVGGVATIKTGLTFSKNGTLVNALPYNAVNFVGAGVASVTDVGGVATVTIPGGTSGLSFEHNGSTSGLTNPYTTANFIGATVTDVGGIVTVTIPSGGVSFQFSGSTSGLTNPYTTVNFEGAGVSWDSSGPPGVLTVNIPGGGSGLSFEYNGSSAGLTNPYLTANFTGQGVSVSNGAGHTALINIPGGVNVLNVLDFGAKGDGVTDDSAAIQAAINAAGYGGIIFFPRLPQNKFTFQQYLVENTLTLDFYANQNGITFLGDGPASASDSFFQVAIVGQLGSYSGTAASITTKVLVSFGYIVTLTGVTGLTSNTKVGDMLVLSNSGSPDLTGNLPNNGVFTITSVSPALQTLTYFGYCPQVNFQNGFTIAPDANNGSIHWTILKNMIQNTAEFTAFRNITLFGAAVGNTIYSTVTNGGGGGNTSLTMEYSCLYRGQIGLNIGDIPFDYGVPLTLGPGPTPVNFTMTASTTINYTGPTLVGTLVPGSIVVFSTQPTVTYTIGSTITSSQISLTTAYNGPTGAATGLWGGLGVYQVSNCEFYRFVKTNFDYNTFAGVKINGSQQKGHNFSMCAFQNQIYGVWLLQGSVAMYDCAYEVNTGSNVMLANPVDTTFISGAQSELSARFLVTGTGSSSGATTGYTAIVQNVRFDTSPANMSPDGRIIQWIFNGGLHLEDCEFSVGEPTFGNQLNGTFNVTNGSPNVTASVSQTGTVVVGSLITFGFSPTQYQVQSITGGTVIVLSSNFTGVTNPTSIAQSTILTVCLTGFANPEGLNAAKPSATITNCYFGNTPQNPNLPPTIVTTNAGLQGRTILWYGLNNFCNNGVGLDYSTPDGMQYVGTAINAGAQGLAGTFTPTTGSNVIATSVSQVGSLSTGVAIKLTGPAAGYFVLTGVTPTSVTIGVPYPATYPGSGSPSAAVIYAGGFNVPMYNLLSLAHPVVSFAIANSAITDLPNNGFTNVELTGGGVSAAIHGMEFNGYNDQIRTITNLTGTTLPFVMESITEPIPINRLHDPAGVGTLNVTRSITLRYSGAISRWVVQSFQ